MNSLSISIAVAALGITSNYGWQPAPQGGTEYIIQIPPESLAALRDGQALASDVRPEAGEIRSFRVVLGTGSLPQSTPMPRKTSLVERPKVEAAKPPVEKPKAEPAAPSKMPVEPAKPWLAMTLTLFGLFASLGANVFLGWVAMELRQRCREKMAVA
ncbi:MAG: hypothetical protein LLG00_07005 [Planctomycetaceae bacterium]|nr:hypothetical protein [Planctomycetaceae bacterium]